MLEKVIVQEYGLDAFAIKITKLASDGWELDTKSNEGYPRQIGVVYTANMIREESTARQTEDVVPVKRGRKSS